MLWKKSDPGAGGDTHELASGVDRVIPNGFEKTCDDELHAARLRLGDEERELVSVQAREYVGGAHMLLDEHRELGQQPVAGSMADAVIDVFEVVEIQDEHGATGARTLRARDLAAELLDEAAPRVERSQRIVVCEKQQVVVETLALGLVTRDQRDDRVPARIRRVGNRGDGYGDLVVAGREQSRLAVPLSFFDCGGDRGVLDLLSGPFR